MTLRRIAILSSVFVCFSTSAPAFARTIVVDNDFADCPQADFNSIQLAVNVAIHTTPANVLELPPAYNAMVTVHPVHARGARVYHFFTPRSPSVAGRPRSGGS